MNLEATCGRNRLNPDRRKPHFAYLSLDHQNISSWISLSFTESLRESLSDFSSAISLIFSDGVFAFFAWVSFQAPDQPRRPASVIIRSGSGCVSCGSSIPSSLMSSSVVRRLSAFRLWRDILHGLSLVILGTLIGYFLNGINAGENVWKCFSGSKHSCSPIKHVFSVCRPCSSTFDKT